VFKEQESGSQGAGQQNIDREEEYGGETCGTDAE
jgi:hypothetical protein